MKDKIYRKKDKLIIEVPLKRKRETPSYIVREGKEQEVHTEMNNIIGVIEADECSFSHLIDMAYKGKSDQISIPFYNFYGEPEEFKSLCNGLDIDVFEYPTCSQCGNAIYGAYTTDGKGGDLCMDCSKKNRKNEKK